MTARDERAVRQSNTPTSGTASSTAARASHTTRAPKRRRVVRTRLRLNDGSGNQNDRAEVVISSGVTIASPSGDNIESDTSSDEEDQRAQVFVGNGPASGGNRPSPPAGPLPTPTATSQLGNQHQRQESTESRQQPSDDLEEMDWWHALTPGQQETMMKRFMLQPPQSAAPASAPVPMYVTTPVNDQTRRRKMKKLKLEPFKGAGCESVEAWLASIPEAVQRQQDLGDENWSTRELYSGVTEHLKEGRTSG
ncbi:hypothetical protein PF010_g21625 [Phytophthora fragariae]|uniref:Uncharacterized protein n=1 Tax=Phytophthora fragariae TaxID=53985 RepID=A0A6G0N3T7_9STRA|nr:hypothetical protein PF010_g21625 [Phytophthora fragariae]KAE9193036.1 hypothetical protein PF004_g21138 [Phytophthora fragariae]